MMEQDFIEKMKEDIIETDSDITMDTSLADIEEWDSLAVVTFVAMATTNGKSLSRDQIKGAHTIRDLYEMMQG